MISTFNSVYDFGKQLQKMLQCKNHYNVNTAYNIECLTGLSKGYGKTNFVFEKYFQRVASACAKRPQKALQ